jgi:beta-N-acetylhexosaminidase
MGLTSISPTPPLGRRPMIPRLRALRRHWCALLAVLVLAACGQQPSAHQRLHRAPLPAPAALAADVRLLQAQQVAAAADRHHQMLLAAANWYLGRLSLDDELGQMIIIQFTQPTYTAEQAQLVQPFHPGGVILYDYAMGTADQVRALLATGQRDSPIPMFTFADLEGGVVDRLEPYLGWRPGAPDMAATGDPALAEQQGERTARDLRSFGLNADLAPDVDVAVAMGPDQQGRTFGSTPQPVITYAGAWLAGLQSQEVVGTLKHFPGLGAATADAHGNIPEIDRTRAQIEATELAPYRALIGSGQVQMVMSTDLLMPALDPNMPAELSRPIVTGILRDELHFQGVAVTDALYMVAERWSLPQAAVLAVEAGNDMIMAPWTPGMVQAVRDGLKQALAGGGLTMQQVDTSVRRILLLKLEQGLLPIPQPVLAQLSPMIS